MHGEGYVGKVAEQSRAERKREGWIGIEIQRRSKKQSRLGKRDKHTHRETDKERERQAQT